MITTVEVMDKLCCVRSFSGQWDKGSHGPRACSRQWSMLSVSGRSLLCVCVLFKVLWWLHCLGQRFEMFLLATTDCHPRLEVWTLLYPLPTTELTHQSLRVIVDLLSHTMSAAPITAEKSRSFLYVATSHSRLEVEPVQTYFPS